MTTLEAKAGNEGVLAKKLELERGPREDGAVERREGGSRSASISAQPLTRQYRAARLRRVKEEPIARNPLLPRLRPLAEQPFTYAMLLREAWMSRTVRLKSAGTWMISILTLLTKSFFVLTMLTIAGAILWATGREVIGILATVVGGVGLFLSFIGAADVEDVVPEAYGRSDNAALRLSKDEARLVTLIRDKNIDPSTIISRIQKAE